MALASDAASIFQCLAAVVRAEGPHALYSGLATTLTGSCNTPLSLSPSSRPRPHTHTGAG
eukprot:4784170-Pleurochrysis_carterae.AAC.13